MNPRSWTRLSALFAFLYQKCLVALRLKRQGDGWRQTCGIALRSEGSKFVLTSFGLHLWSDLPLEAVEQQSPRPGAASRQLARRLAEFLQNEPAIRVRLREEGDLTRVLPAAAPILVLADFGRNGDLLRVVPYPDTQATYPELTAEQQRGIENTLVWVMNRTRALGDMMWRSRFDARFEQALRDEPQIGKDKAARRYAQDLLGGVWLSCVESGLETLGRPERFWPPDFIHRRPIGPTLLNIVARISADKLSADLWVQIHHAGADGAPVQEILNRLEKEWGIDKGILYPSETQSRKFENPRNCAVNGHRALEHAAGFLDFSPLLQWRKRIQDELNSPPHDQPLGFPVAAALVWVLAHEPTLSGIRFAVAVEVPESPGDDRSVNFVVTRPADFLRQGGLEVFIRDFNNQVRQTRERRSSLYKQTSLMGLLPARLVKRVLQLYPERTRENFGTLGISLLRDARVFIAPMADIGFDDGFIAIGSMALQGVDGQTVGCATIKGPAATVGRHLEILRQAIASVEFHPSTPEYTITVLTKSPSKERGLELA